MSIELLELQIVAGLKEYLPSKMNIKLDYFAVTLILSLIASVAVYPMFKYINRFVASYSDCTKESSKRVYGLLIILPLFFSTLWIKPMLKNFLHDTPEENFYFLLTKILLVFALSTGKLLHIRTEIQCMFNHTTKIVQEYLSHPNKDNLELCTKKCRVIATIAWPVTHQAMCCSFYLILLIFLLVTKGGIASSYPKPITEAIIMPNNNLGFDEDEFMVKESLNKVIMKNVTYVEEIEKLTKIIKDIVPDEGKSMMDSIAGISKTTFIHPIFYRDLCEFLIWSYFIAWSLGTLMNFLFININPSKSKTS